MKYFVLIALGFVFGCVGISRAPQIDSMAFSTSEGPWLDKVAVMASMAKVITLNDEDRSVLVGHGVISWEHFGGLCYSAYTFTLGLDRIKFRIDQGVPIESACTTWDWPTVDGYHEIRNKFRVIAKNLGVESNRIRSPTN